MGNSQQDWWNGRFQNNKNLIDNSRNVELDIAKALDDKIWIEEWNGFCDLLKVNPKPKVIDLGCGLGALSKFFASKGCEVVAVDFSQNAIDIVQSHVRGVNAFVHDITRSLPFDDVYFDVVVANLSLHYFNEADTHNIISEIKRILKPNGILIGAVLSMEEWEFAKKRGKFVEVEPNFYHEMFGDKIKHVRFFDRKDIDKFFVGFEFLYLNSKVEQRMGKLKGAWEFVGRNKCN